MLLRAFFAVGLTCLSLGARADEGGTADSSKPITPLVFNPASEGHKGVSKHDPHATLVINVGSAAVAPAPGGRHKHHRRIAARPGSAPRALR